MMNTTKYFQNLNACSSQAIDNIQMNFETTELIFWSNIITCVLNGITWITAITGNGLVLAAILSSQMRRQPCMLLLCSLAMADFLVGLLVQPLYVIYKVAEIYKRWSIVCYVKLVHVCVGFTTTGVSLMSLMVIAIERLLAVSLHLRYAELVTTKRVKLVVFSLWLISVANTGLKFIEKDIFQATVLIMEIISIIIAAFSYHKVYKIVQKHREAIQKHAPKCNEIDVEKYQKSAMTMFVIFMFSLLCYLPFSAYIALEAVYGFTVTIKALANIATTVICIISSCNPCIYCFRMQEIRKAVIKLLRIKTSASIPISAGNVNATPTIR